MGYSRDAGDDRQKKTWRGKLDLLEKNFIALKPNKECEISREIDLWEQWNRKINRIKTSITVYSRHDGEAYLRITHTLDELEKYVRGHKPSAQFARLFNEESKQATSTMTATRPTQTFQS